LDAERAGLTHEEYEVIESSMGSFLSAS